MMTTLLKLFRKPNFYLFLATGIGCVLLFVSLLGHNLYRDVANCYAYAIREAVLYGNWNYVLDPGLPVLSMISGVPFALCGLEASRALILACGMFWIATVFPLYSLLKRFISPLAASIGTLLFILAPKLIRFSCAGMPEAPRNFFLVLSFLMLFMLIECKKVRNIIFFAFSLAGLTIARSEGFVISVVFLLLFFGNEIWLIHKDFCLRKLMRAMFLGFMATGLFLFFLSPKLIYNYEKTGYPTIDTRYNPYLNALFRFDRFVVLPEDYPPPRSIAESAAAYKDESLFPWGKNLRTTIKNTFRGAYELYFFPALLGLLCCIFRFSAPFKRFKMQVPEIVRIGWRMEYTDALIVILFHEILYFTDCSAHRYYTFLLPLILPFTMLFLLWIWNLSSLVPARFHVRACLILGGCVIIGLQISNGLDFVFRRYYEWEAGNYLKMHARDFCRTIKTERIRIYKKYPEVAYYSGFEYTNSSLNSKSRKLTAAENVFDLAVFRAKDNEWQKFAQVHNLVEWTAHPYAKYIRILIPEQKNGVFQ